MARFTGVPVVPTSGLPELQANLFSSLKENVELLTGARGEADSDSRALVRSDVQAKQVGTQTMVSVQGVAEEGYTGAHDNANEIASLAALRALRDDVQVLANDLFTTRQALDLLISNFGGR